MHIICRRRDAWGLFLGEQYLGDVKPQEIAEHLFRLYGRKLPEKDNAFLFSFMHYGGPPSLKQIRWLRDIWDRKVPAERIDDEVVFPCWWLW
jgi:hypothetical protein